VRSSGSAGPTGRSASSGAHGLSGRPLRQQIFARQTFDLDTAQHEIRERRARALCDAAGDEVGVALDCDGIEAPRLGSGLAADPGTLWR
jgi:hypothetical protein